MKKGLFHFKQFSLSHERSSMKVGVDGVLIGSWASATGKNILDAGTGCGVIAMMLAQRNADAEIVAIDVDEKSIEESTENFINSKWNNRLKPSLISFDNLVKRNKECFDMIVSNPPFFKSGVTEPSTARELARHQAEFSPFVLIEGASSLLREGGRVAMIMPNEFFKESVDYGALNGLVADRALFVRNNPSSVIKRVMVEFVKTRHEHFTPCRLQEDKIPILTMFDNRGEPTEEYVELGKDFYLKF